MIDDAALLHRFAEQRDEAALAELVQRHVNLVYFSALRQTNGATALAEDAAQATFSLLAKKAASLLRHPNLSGWLHTTACHQARDLMRSEQRRREREIAAHTLQTNIATEANDETWLRVRPIVDDALADLVSDDREAVLLRYFENRSYSEIGDALKLGENAARMRVTRALGQLETALARRGVKSTAAALATVLAIPAAMAAPDGLAHTLSATALTASAVAGTSVTVLNLFNIMSSAKLIATATTLAALVAITTAVYQNKQLQTSRHETASIRQQQSDFQSQLAGLKDQLATEKKRADDADADNGLLLAATSNVLAAKNAPQIPITKDVVDKRWANAKALAKSGQSEEALKEYVWCYDTGMPQVSSYGGVRSSYLLNEIAKLGKTYPPALAVLKERRDAAEQLMRTSATDSNAVGEYATLNRALGEDEKNLALYTSLPADDERRRTLSFYVGDQLLTAQRYAEFVESRPFPRMMGFFGMTTDSSNRRKLSPEQLKGITNSVASSTAKNIEALAGAGDLPHASKLISSLLEFDNSAETRAKIQQHLTRAGHPELLK